MKYLGYSWYLKLGRFWIRLWGKRCDVLRIYGTPNGIHRVSYLIFPQ